MAIQPNALPQQLNAKLLTGAEPITVALKKDLSDLLGYQNAGFQNDLEKSIQDQLDSNLEKNTTQIPILNSNPNPNLIPNLIPSSHQAITLDSSLVPSEGSSQMVAPDARLVDSMKASFSLSPNLSLNSLSADSVLKAPGESTGAFPQVMTSDLNQKPSLKQKAQTVTQLPANLNQDSAINQANQNRVIQNLKNKNILNQASVANPNQKKQLSSALSSAMATQNEAQVSSPINTQLNSQLAALGLPQQDLEMESLEVETLEKMNPKALASSKLSANDYLNLREVTQVAQKNPETRMLDGSFSASALSVEQLKSEILKGQKRTKNEGNALEMAAGVTTLQDQNHALAPKVIEAPVTRGFENKMVLTHDTINQLSQQMNQLSQAHQDGEIKIRLRPDHLGELQMSVRTSGQQVILQIKAQSAEAKKVIEDSMSSLRDNLSGQNLMLSKVEVVIPTQNMAASDSAMQLDTGTSRNQNSSSQQDQAFSERRENSRARFDEESLSPQVSRMKNYARSGSQRLDLIA